MQERTLQTYLPEQRERPLPTEPYTLGKVLLTTPWSHLFGTAEEEIVEEHALTNLTWSSEMTRSVKHRCRIMGRQTQYSPTHSNPSETSETLEGRSATFRVQGFVFFFFIVGLNCRTISCDISLKKSFFLSRLGRYTLQASFFLSLIFDLFDLTLFFLFFLYAKKKAKIN